MTQPPSLAGGAVAPSSPYERLKLIAARRGVPAGSLIARSARRDPFYCGSPAQTRDAEWFASLYESIGFSGVRDVHLRRIHYRLISQANPVIRPDGSPYENTDKDWTWFCETAVFARTLGLVDVKNFIDNRNPDPVIMRAYAGGTRQIELDMRSWWTPSIDGIDTRLEAPDFEIPSPGVSGYGYSDDDQPYLLEIWIEKTTLNDVLLPICREYRINLVPAAGFQSITAANNLIERARRVGKPARAFFISDFDPAGVEMPPSVARQVEFHLSQATDSEKIDIAIDPIMLTFAQANQYQLPRTPIKETDTRRARFESTYGRGATELDALEALHPGVARGIVLDAVKRYWDPNLRRRMNEQQAELQDDVTRQWSRLIQDEAEELSDIASETMAVYSRYQDELNALAARMDGELEPLRRNIEAIGSSIEAKMELFDYDLPAVVTSDLTPPDEREALYLSSRDYMAQLAEYRRRYPKAPRKPGKPSAKRAPPAKRSNAA